MKTGRLIFSMAVVSVLLSCNWNSENEQQQTLEDISKQELATALAERDELLSLVKDVSTGLAQIKQLEKITTIAATNPHENAGQKARILSDISNLKEQIRQRKDRLRQLEDKLQNSTINSKELQETVGALSLQMDSQMEEIELLRRQLVAANEQIGALSNAVDSLNMTVSAVCDERDMAQAASIRFENELNVCYYVIGTKSELKDHNIIESGFLRKTKLLQGDFDKEFFVMSDKRTLDMLPLHGKRARILTTHPEASFEITEESGQKVLRINDPSLFWSLSNYLVVQTD